MSPLPPSPLGWIYLAVFCGLVPWAALRSAARFRASSTMPSRAAHLVSLFSSQGIMLLLALLTAWREAIPLFPRPHLVVAGILAAAGLAALSLSTLPWRWSWRTVEEKKRRLWALPGKVSDLWWWTLVALTAGVVEEIAYRGVLFTLLARLTGSWWASVLVAVTVFGLAHAIQGARTVTITAVLSIGMHVLVRLTGDLYTAMAMHFLYDLLAGALLLHLARRDGLLE